MKYAASIEIVQAVFKAYPAAIYSLNNDMNNSGFSIDVVATYDVSLDVIFYIMQQDITYIVGKINEVSRRRQLDNDSK